MNLPMPVAMGIWIVIGLLILALIVRGLSRRRRDGADVVPALDLLPDEDNRGTEICAGFDAIYVSTTRHGDWLARIGVFGLGNRSNARVQVFTSGVLLSREGEADVFIPSHRIESATTTSGISGKYIPHDGLDVVTWRPAKSTELVDTGLRIADRGARKNFQNALTTLTSSHTMTLEENS